MSWKLGNDSAHYEKRRLGDGFAIPVHCFLARTARRIMDGSYCKMQEVNWEVEFVEDLRQVMQVVRRIPSCRLRHTDFTRGQHSDPASNSSEVKDRLRKHT